ncbi:MAG: RAD55 family ATPase [Thermoplasmata archaeon]
MEEMKGYRTYVKGLDEEIEGGIPQGHVILIAGPPGTMKSSLAYSILYHNAAQKKVRSMYFTLEQSRRSLEFQMSRLSMDPKLVMDSLRVQDLSRIRKGIDEVRGRPRFGRETERPWLEVMKKILEDLKETENFELLAVDSLPILEIISRLKDRRIQLFHFFEWLRDLDLTTIIITETSPQIGEVHDEDFLADGVIHVLMEKVGDIDVYRRIRIVKLRGVNHNTGFFTLEYKQGRFQVSQVI